MTEFEKAAVVCLLIANLCLHQLLVASEIHVNIHDEAGHKHLYNIKIGRDKVSASSTDHVDSSHRFANKLASNFNVGHNSKVDGSESDSSLLERMKLTAAKSDSLRDGILSFSSNSHFLSSDGGKTGMEAFLPTEVSDECLVRQRRPDLPIGLCYNEGGSSASHSKAMFKTYAKSILDKRKLPLTSGNLELDEKLAYGVVMMNLGFVEDSIEHLTALINENPTFLALYFARAAAFLRKSAKENIDLALENLDKAVSLNVSRSTSYDKRSGLLFIRGRVEDAIRDLNTSVQLNPSWRNIYQRGLFYFVSENFAAAEEDFRTALNRKQNDIFIMHQLGLALYNRGRLRRAVHVFLEVIQANGDSLDVDFSLALTHSKLGNYEQSLHFFDKCLSFGPSPAQQAAIYQSKASLHYSAGAVKKAHKDALKCVKNDDKNHLCLYLLSVTQTSLGRFYDSIKSATKLMVLNNLSRVRVSPEFVKIHYLREWARYVHNKLENNIHELNMSRDLSGEFRDKWVKGIPIDFVMNYQEQPGLQPHIADVQHWKDMESAKYSKAVQKLICRAKKVGQAFRMKSDGFINNNRLHFALGLAAIHTAQLLDDYWDSLVSSSKQESKGATGRSHLHKMSWAYVAELTSRYYQLANPDSPLMWLHQMPTVYLRDGYTVEKNFVRGHFENIKLMPYFRLVFHLVRTMVEYMQGDSREANSKDLVDEIKNARDCYQLLRVAKKKGTFSQSGIMVSTQVPSLKYKDAYQHEGDSILLSEDHDRQPVLSLNILTNADRIQTYQEELNFLFAKLTDDVIRNRQGTLRSDTLVDSALSLLYYMCNANLLSHGTGFISYSVTIGALMALGYEVKGRIPTGKLIDIEPLLAGTPDAFFLVTKQWLKHERNPEVVSNLVSVETAFPTIRSLLEVFSVGSSAKCDQISL